MFPKFHEEDHVSCYTIHPCSTNMYHELRKIYWWDGLKKDIAEFVDKCLNCEKMKDEHQKLGGSLQEIKVPTLKWEDINMDFLVGLPQTQRQHDSIWLVVDRLTKSTHFFPVKSTYSTEDYSRIFKDDIACRQGILLSIISNWGEQFTSRFCWSLQEWLGTKVKFPTDGQSGGYYSNP